MNLATAPNVVFHYFLYFSSPFANFSKGLEIRLSLSPATLFSGASLPNHTKMFELVHLVTSMEDFDIVQVQRVLCVGKYIFLKTKIRNFWKHYFFVYSLVICEEMKKFNSNPEENNPDKIATLRYRTETATHFLQYELSNEDLKSYSWCVFYSLFRKCLTVWIRFDLLVNLKFCGIAWL
jgi:hypothetical protein